MVINHEANTKASHITLFTGNKIIVLNSIKVIVVLFFILFKSIIYRNPRSLRHRVLMGVGKEGAFPSNLDCGILLVRPNMYIHT